ncbi:MAG: rhomboid family intramembrane serine protease [Solirubrobacteraceae bacterium]|jgi:membrane associated rhomboid family serine protease|nr:rhomboid family intramembrane serine protease [Solirubrobacteraceae bacterium]MCU0312876.1 rhomboid family intramembrane serine protease [Solirubrobacteraceae bacterium]
MSQAPDLFVVCKSCGSEVSSYVTECPYCGTRLRKRAPKLGGTELAEGRRSRRPKAPKLPRMRPGEIPGIRVDAEHRPLAAIVLAILCAAGTISLAVFSPADVGVVGPVDGEWWRVATAPFFADELWYAGAVIFTVVLFGVLLERRHGHVAVLLLFCLCGMGGIAAAAALETVPLALGANGAALGLLAAWAVRPALEARRGEPLEADLLGAGVIAITVLAMPLLVEEASPTAGATGLLAGLLAGLLLARR